MHQLQRQEKVQCKDIVIIAISIKIPQLASTNRDTKLAMEKPFLFCCSKIYSEMYLRPKALRNFINKYVSALLSHPYLDLFSPFLLRIRDEMFLKLSYLRRTKWVTFAARAWLITSRVMNITFERLSMTFSANGKNETFAVSPQLRVQ